MLGARHDIEAVLRQLDRPLRAWSLIVTIFGDAVVPRGGSLWLGTLLEIMAAFGVEPGGVRTATSRLVGDGWLIRDRIGRNSFYRFSDVAMQASSAAAMRVYGGAAPSSGAHLTLTVVTDEASVGRVQERERLLRAGARPLATDIFLVLSGRSGLPASSSTSLVLDVMPRDDNDAQRLARMAWPLDELARAYRRFNQVFTPVGQRVASSDLDALALRLLVVHELRRIVLRDPGLPAAWLGEDWPGTGARHLAASIWHATLDPSERWLDQNGKSQDGALPSAGPELRQRFSVRERA